MIADYDGDITELLKDRESGTYPIICTRDLVIFPTVLTPIILGRKQSIAVVDYLKQKNDDLIFCALLKRMPIWMIQKRKTSLKLVFSAVSLKW